MSRDGSLLIGAHTSAAGGSFHALLQGREIGADTVQIFTSNQKQWKGRTISSEEIARWRALRKETHIDVVMSHSSYLINLGSIKPDLLEKSRKAFCEEIRRCHLLEIEYLNFHPGAFTTGDPDTCIDTIVASILSFKAILEQGGTRLLLETTAGQGTTVGYSFEQLGTIIHRVGTAVPLGICIDTCHIFAAGYDIRTPKAWKETLIKFDQAIGLQHLYALHLNDSLKPLGSKRDRHACIGKGEIGKEAFSFIVNDPTLSRLPMYLETPEPEHWKEEIALLRTMRHTA